MGAAKLAVLALRDRCVPTARSLPERLRAVRSDAEECRGAAASFVAAVPAGGVGVPASRLAPVRLAEVADACAVEHPDRTSVPARARPFRVMPLRGPTRRMPQLGEQAVDVNVHLLLLFGDGAHRVH